MNNYSILDWDVYEKCPGESQKSRAIRLFYALMDEAENTQIVIVSMSYSGATKKELEYLFSRYVSYRARCKAIMRMFINK